ncbi:minichromosome maintenance protein 3 [Strigomonas culicis]|uniref:DNA replication licensing factor MCM3 n=1 Tax=Strigomonas culicis TaxID=28005 RepID=S9VX56_9TRYP|nr:minichromosome maintenance protein 3 [Strigomonas culicis]|eukprot:EPY28160.1 minichromosome maintenance protein 3 [Strigomonas culicis]
MLSNRTLTEEQTLIRRHFTDFFESERYEEKYHRRIQAMIVADKARLVMDIGDLLDFHLDVASLEAAGGVGGDGGATNPNTPTSLGMGIIREPGKYLPLLELALHDVVLRQQPEYLKVDYRSRAVHIGFEGPVGTVLSPRELYARHLNTMVALEGIVTRQSTNRPRVLETVHYCPETNKFTKKEFRDQLTPMLDSSHLPTVNVMPKTDMEGHALRTELGLSTFMDSQCAILQEAPERAPTGQLPRNVEVRFDDDLVDAVKPGDRVVVVGVFMPYTTADSKSFQSIVLVNHVAPTQAAAYLSRYISSVEDRLVAFAKKSIHREGPSGVLQVLAKAVAPTLYGITHEKRAVLLLMVGGVERQAHNTHIRGDINVLLVGEPSTAKSQLLRFVLGVAPLALSTTGKGSSGVGLTAAVAVDAYTGERSLSAGAMVLADRGILCIDEFDKMGASDRVAMHEAMEQQTVTIAKAGVHASLNARCSVLAAANPIYGFYSVHHRLAFNVGLPESLLSRFDLTFIILDQHSSAHNRRIATHILRNHMTSTPVTLDPVVTKTIVDGGVDAGPRGGRRERGWGDAARPGLSHDREQYGREHRERGLPAGVHPVLQGRQPAPHGGLAAARQPALRAVARGAAGRHPRRLLRHRANAGVDHPPRHRPREAAAVADGGGGRRGGCDGAAAVVRARRVGCDAAARRRQPHLARGGGARRRSRGGDRGGAQARHRCRRRRAQPRGGRAAAHAAGGHHAPRACRQRRQRAVPP